MNRVGLVITLLLLISAINSEAQVLKVGDRAPDIKVYDWIKGKPVNKFNKGKVYVVEFGATWCIPCAAMIPKLSSLAKKYPEEVNVSGYFVMENEKGVAANGVPNYVNKVKKYVLRQGENIRYNIAVDDTTKWMEMKWLKAAGKDGIPYSFVVDKNGKIAWIGTGDDMLFKAVDMVLDKNYKLEEAIASSEKREALETKYDDTAPLLVNGNGGADTAFLFRSLLTKYKGDIKTPQNLFVQSHLNAAEGTAEYKKRGMVQEVGASLKYLYYMAYADTTFNYPMPGTGIAAGWLTSYGKYWGEPILEVKAEAPFVATSARPENKYNYSLKVPVEKATAKFLQECMQRDLKNYFNYDVAVETRKMPYWKLVADDEAKTKLRTKDPLETPRTIDFDVEKGFTGINSPVRTIIFVLWGYALKQAKDAPPIIDETGITGNLDFILNANLYDFESMRAGLAAIGLKLVKGVKDMKVVVIRDVE